MRLAFEATIARVAKTLDMIWPGARVTTFDDSRMGVRITCETQLACGQRVISSRVFDHRWLAHSPEQVFYYLMQEIPRDHVDGILEAAIKAAEVGRHNSHTTIQEGFDAHPYR